MAISRASKIDFAAISSEMRGIVSRWYNATLTIVDPNTGDLSWNISTNTYSGNPAVTIWSGSGRIQPIKAPFVSKSGEVYDTSIETFTVQVPYDNTLNFIRPGMSIVITDGGENHYLEEINLTIISAVNSSYGWNTTLECQADGKSVSNG